VRAARIDGMVVMNPRGDDAPAGRADRLGLPGGHDRPSPRRSRPRARRRQRRRGALATEHLLGLGRRRLAHLAYGDRRFTTVAERLAGFRAALRRRPAVRSRPRRLRELLRGQRRRGDARCSTGWATAAAPRPPFDGLVCGNDTVALGALTALRRRGLRVPDDVAVVGFDDIPMAAHACPPLTTVRSPLLAMGAAAGTSSST
jgi:DNA-binding LacI/PurR family transcriptional regulator